MVNEYQRSLDWTDFNVIRHPTLEYSLCFSYLVVMVMALEEMTVDDNLVMELRRRDAIEYSTSVATSPVAPHGVL